MNMNELQTSFQVRRLEGRAYVQGTGRLQRSTRFLACGRSSENTVYIATLDCDSDPLFEL